ncbi:AI-2E family transporter YdiK [Crenobacter sp. SG2303]|uniref:AI-2E family transporter YdiK n=1 Tax=Crenobacter oryzisoli TaxID=3056844 RepID=A0ABT7XLF1_9NEIS|nr:AI-2E family transporter YdiK [Crenobacter sp. SG2303]MDN0074612.1 AI-2E family transporter YdiK [Crenobacter sp. SG2303]
MNGSPVPSDTRPPKDTEARRGSDLARIVLAVGTLLLLIGGSLYVLRPFVPAIIWGGMIVVSTWPALLALQHRLHERRGLAVLIMLLMQIVVIIVPIYLAVATFVENAADVRVFVQGLPTYALPSPPHWLAGVPVVGSRLTHQWQLLADAGPGGVLARVQPYAAMVTRWLLTQISLLGLFMLQLLLMVIVCGLLYAKGEVAAHLVIGLAQRVAPQNGAEIIHLAGQAIRAIALGVVVTAVVQASLGAFGILVAGIPYAGILSALLFVVCLLQIGPLIPLLGCVAWLFMNGSQFAAVLLLVWSIGVGMVDNILRPILIRRAIELPLALILSGVLGGLLTIGVVGLFIGPVILAVTYHLLLAWIEPAAPSTTVAADKTERQERD